MNQSAFARVMGVHKSQVTRWIAAGMPVEQEGAINAETAAQWVHLNIDPTQRIHTARTNAHRAEHQRREAHRSDVPKPTCTDHISDPVDGALVAALPLLAYQIPATAAVLAVHVGAPLRVAYALYRALQVGILQEVTELLEALDVPAPDGADDWSHAPLWNPDLFRAVNWPSLAESSGEPVDLAAWGKYWETLPFYEAPEDPTKAAPIKGGRKRRARA